ncbi:hypothetical protein C5167_030155 [Papaver somniferum]|nr:hypothetical protein C5167_030155 [Papaver somniferum]
MEYMMMYDIIVVSRGGNRSRENASEDHRGISDSVSCLYQPQARDDLAFLGEKSSEFVSWCRNGSC